MGQKNYKKNTIKAEPSIINICNICKGKYFRGAKEGANTADVVKEFGVCAASCVPSVSSASASCPYATKKVL